MKGMKSSMYKVGYCMVCGRKCKETMCKTCYNYEMKLAEKEKEIERLKAHEDYKFEILYPKVKILGRTYEDIQEILDEWLKMGSEDKILFAVEQLEEVKEHISRGLAFDKDVKMWFEEYIDNQIKQLKEEN